MFKNIFAKYVVAFMLIILSSFLVIIFIVSSIIVSYSTDAKHDIMENSAKSSVTYVEGLFNRSASDSVYGVVNPVRAEAESMLGTISANADDITILVSDNSGRIVLQVGADKTREGANIPKAFMDEINNGSAVSGKDAKLKGVFRTERYVHAVPIYNNDEAVCGTVFVCAESQMLSELLQTIIKAIVVAILWVLLAALIAVYFITERITSPLKDISNAAKQFARGKFDVRVPVRGNDEIAELSVAINNMAESLDNYDTMRNTFMSNVSHDLRSPMTSISGFVDGILDGVIPPDKHEYYLRIVSTEIKRLSRLVASLLDLSRIQAGDRKFTMAPFDICEMCREIVISIEKKINDKSLEVEFDCSDDELTVLADRDAIYQVVYNLCDNAMKFACEGGVFRIGIKRLKNKKALVTVYNEGHGIDPADLPY
ncbi:MAG: HAMP domain-containing protein, partial [Clostridia bacterium]|nr:HAMP domain-containing protein [Clostridia bacterium]